MEESACAFLELSLRETHAGRAFSGSVLLSFLPSTSRQPRSALLREAQLEFILAEQLLGDERQDLREAELELEAGSAEGLLLAGRSRPTIETWQTIEAGIMKLRSATVSR